MRACRRGFIPAAAGRKPMTMTDPSRPTETPGARQARHMRSSDTMTAWLMIAPLAAVLLAVAIYPILYSLVTSFYQVNLARPAVRPFVGLQNYINLLGDPAIHHALKQTAIYGVVTVVGTLLAGLAAALLLNEVFRGRRILAILLLVPWATPSVVNGLMWKWIYDPNYGVLNSLLKSVGLIDTYQIWLADPNKTLLLIANASIWKQMPLAAILLLVTMKSISAELYKAAKIDGANALQRFWHITLPALRPGIILVLLYDAMIAIRHFDLFMLLTQGGPGNASTVLSWEIYMRTFRSLRFGEGSALAYIMALITIIVGTIILLAGRDRGDRA